MASVKSNFDWKSLHLHTHTHTRTRMHAHTHTHTHTKANRQNETWHWTNDEIGVAVQSWLWVRAEPKAWQLSRLERLNGIQWSWVQISLRPTFYSYFKEPVSGEYHIYQLISLHSCDYLQKTSIKTNVAIDEGKQVKWNVTLNKQWNWTSCTKLTLSTRWTHGLIAQSVRASEQNLVVVGSNPTQANFL